MTVRSTAAATAAVNGGGRVQLFVMWEAPTVANTTLMIGHAANSNLNATDFGGAIRARLSAKLSIANSVFSINSAPESGGAP